MRYRFTDTQIQNSESEIRPWKQDSSDAIVLPRYQLQRCQQDNDRRSSN